MGGLEPFNITDIENGTVTLDAVIGTQTSPVYEITNNNTPTLNTITLVFNGFLQANQFLNSQTNGPFAGASSTVMASQTSNTPAGCATGNSNSTNTDQNPCLPVTLTYTNLDISANSTFDITFASFGNGASGGATGPGTPPPAIPEPASLALLGSALVGFGIFSRRQRRG